MRSVESTVSMTGVRSDWAWDPTAAMWWKPVKWAVHCWETKRAREEESAARRACGEEEKEGRREGVKEIEMERRNRKVRKSEERRCCSR